MERGATKDDRLHVLSYNIHKGFSMSRKLVLANIKEAIRTVKADLVFLQEVVGEHSGHSKRIKEWPVEPQLEYLADTIWPHFAYGKNAVYNEGHHGNAILSLHPFTNFENIDISTNRFERRGLLHGTIALGGDRDLHVICVHLNLFEKSRLRQVDWICARIEEHVPHDAPLIIAGDFNDWRESASDPLESILEVREAHRAFCGEHARTFPSWLPMLPLDRIYVRGLEIADSRCLTGAPWNQLSDHAALYAELALA